MTAKAIFCLICLLALAACDTVTTESPIGASEATETDEQLIGTWKFVDMPKALSEEGTVYAFFLPRKEGGFNTVAVGFGADKKDSGYFGLEIHTGRVGDVRFMNAIPKVDDGKPEDDIGGYWPVLYRFDAGGRLLVYKISDDGMKVLERAIDEHRLAGTVTKHSLLTKQDGGANEPTDIRITADQKSLDTFFNTNAAQIFSEPAWTLQRVTMP